jgi:hypothetical protein
MAGEDLRVVWERRVEGGYPCGCAVDPSGSLCAVAVSTLEGDRWDGSLEVLDCVGGGMVGRTALESGASCVAFLSRSSVAVGCDDGTVRVRVWWAAMWGEEWEGGRRVREERGRGRW